MGKYLWNKEKVISAVKNNISYAGVLRELGIPLAGNNTATLKRKIENWNLNTSHFTHSKVKKFDTKILSVEEYLNNTVKITAYKLKNKLLKEGLKKNICERCGISEWQGSPLNIQLHHIDGNPDNNSLENLQMLCPNCHSQTDSYCGNKKEKQKYYCPDCGKEINKTSTRCVSCALKARGATKVTLSKEELQNLLDEGYNKVQISKMFGVTEAAIRKWIKKFQL